MSSNTPNYNLIKPDPSDFYNITDFNNNSDKIDTALGQKLNVTAFKNTLDLYKSTQAQAREGLDDTSYMTPIKVSTNHVTANKTRVAEVELNSYINPGEYALGSNISVNGVVLAANSFGSLKVLRSSDIITQILYRFQGAILARTFSTSASTFPDFVKFSDPSITIDSVGNMSNLVTSAKNTLVNALNEVSNNAVKTSNKATTAQAQSGTDDSAYMTPAKTLQAMAVFGLGGNSAKAVSSGSYNDINIGGIYAISSAVAGGPNSESSTLFHLPGTSNSAIQIDITNSTNSVNVRSLSGGNWSSWDNISNNGIIGLLSSLTTTNKANLVAAINEVKATSISVSAKASTNQAQSGVDDSAYMTPLKTKEAIDTLSKRVVNLSINAYDGLTTAESYPLGITTFFSNNPENKFNGLPLCGVFTNTYYRNGNITGAFQIISPYRESVEGTAAYIRFSQFTSAGAPSQWTPFVKLNVGEDIGNLASLQTSIKTNLVAAINSAYNDTLKLNAKASTSQAQTGTNDDTYMTPLKTNQAVDYLLNRARATEEQAKSGTSNDSLMTPLRVNNVTGTLTNLQTTDKSSLVAAINENFTRVVNGKGLIATAINDMGGSASGSDSFQELADDIREIVPKYASGTIAVSAPLTPYSYYDASGTESMASVIVSGLTFQPTRIVIIGTGGISRITEYDFELGALSESIRCSAYTGNRRDSGATYHFKNTGNAYVTETGFKLPLISGSDNATWYAYE